MRKKEIALVGSTSEDVDATLDSGEFGAEKETGEILNSAACLGRDEKLGLGEAMGRELTSLRSQNADKSVLCAAYLSRVPVTRILR